MMMSINKATVLHTIHVLLELLCYFYVVMDGHYHYLHIFMLKQDIITIQGLY